MVHRRTRAAVIAATAAAACLLIAGPALARSWTVTSYPASTAIGYVNAASGGKFVVLNASSKSVGKVVKVKSGAWKIYKGSKKIGVAKANGPKKYPVNIYANSGQRIGRCGKKSGFWQVERLQRIGGTNSYVISVEARVDGGCPARAAAGAGRVLHWK